MERVVTFYEHEENMVRMERSNRRLWILCVILIVALLGTNAGWLYYESQFEYYTNSVEQQVETGDGENTTVIGVGDYNGEGKADDNE